MEKSLDQMVTESEALVRTAYKVGREHGHADGCLHEEAAYKRGVKDGWATIINTLKILGNDEDIKPEERAVMRALVHTFSSEDAVEHTKSFVEVRDMVVGVKFVKEIEKIQKPKIIGFGEVKK